MDALTKLRGQIDRIDQVIITALGERMDLMESFAKVKQREGIEIFQEQRDHEVMRRVKDLSKGYSLDQRMVQSIYKLILEESVRLQQKHFEK